MISLARDRVELSEDFTRDITDQIRGTAGGDLLAELIDDCVFGVPPSAHQKRGGRLLSTDCQGFTLIVSENGGVGIKVSHPDLRNSANRMAAAEPLTETTFQLGEIKPGDNPYQPMKIDGTRKEQLKALQALHSVLRSNL